MQNFASQYCRFSLPNPTTIAAGAQMQTNERTHQHIRLIVVPPGGVNN